MKRRLFLQSLGAMVGGGLFRPALSLATVGNSTAQNIAVSGVAPSSYMQAQALAILRQNPTISHSAFLAKTGLDEANAKFILNRFVQMGHLDAQAFKGGALRVVKPEWMERAKIFAQSLRETGQTALRQVLDAEGDMPRFDEIKRCCKAKDLAHFENVEPDDNSN